MEILSALQELALASRLKRLGEMLLKDVSSVYRELGIDFQARWFPVFFTLGRKSPLAVTELARAIGLSHPAINQVARQMIKHGLINEMKDRQDDRKRLLSLTDSGRQLLHRLEPVWEEIRIANRDLLVESKTDLLGDLSRVEELLVQQSMLCRVRQRLDLPQTEPLRLVDYRPAYKKHFKSLNEEWLRDLFEVEERDAWLLEDPNQRILKKGGAIVFALLGEEVVGTCALLRHRGEVFELAKMAVTKKQRGQGIGAAMTHDIIHRTQQFGTEYLYLQTSPQLKAALRLYHRFGFRQTKSCPLPAHMIYRETIMMRLKLANYKPPTSDAATGSTPVSGTAP